MPSVSRSVRARSLSAKGQRSTRTSRPSARACASVSADLRQFRIRIGDPGKGAVIDLGRQAKERVTDHDPGMKAGDVGELRAAGDIADGVGAAIGGAQPGVHRNPAGVEGDAGHRQVEGFDGRAPARGDQQVRPDDQLAIAKTDRNAVAVALDRGDFYARAQIDPFARKPAPREARSIRDRRAAGSDRRRAP